MDKGMQAKTSVGLADHRIAETAMTRPLLSISRLKGESVK